MARKSKKIKDSQEYWEKRLRKEGLSMERGRNRRLSYVGTSVDLERIIAINLEGEEYESRRQ